MIAPAAPGGQGYIGPQGRDIIRPMSESPSDFKATQERLRPRVAETESLDAVASDVDTLRITKRTRNLDRLPELSALRALSAAELGERDVALICAATQLTHLSVNVAALRSLEPLGALANLTALALFQNARLKSLEGLEKLVNLQYLELANFGITASLDPLSACVDLRALWLSGTMWTPLRVDTLRPLASLKRLERLVLQGVRVRDKTLDPLHGLHSLREVTLPRTFPQGELAALAIALPNTGGNLHRSDRW